MTLLREQQQQGELEHIGPLHGVHRLDRGTSGLLMVAKSAAAARELSMLLRERRLHKYYVALTSRRPSQKQGRVRGDMARSRRGQWKLLRSTDNPAVTAFMSTSLSLAGDGECGSPAAGRAGLRAFLLKPSTGRTHQLRVAMKSVGAPVLGDATYAAADAARGEERAYLHAAALRLPASAALCESGEPTRVLCPPTDGAEFLSDAFRALWDGWFDPGSVPAAGVWFDGTAVSSATPVALPRERRASDSRR